MLTRAQLDIVEVVSHGPLDLGVEDLEDCIPPEWVFNHLSDLYLFDWFNQDVKLVLTTVLGELYFEVGSLFEVLEPPNHSPTLDHILYLLLQFFIYLFVDQFVKVCAVLGDLRLSVDCKLVHHVVLLVELYPIQVRKERASLRVFEFSSVLAFSPRKNLNLLLLFTLHALYYWINYKLFISNPHK